MNKGIWRIMGGILLLLIGVIGVPALMILPLFTAQSDTNQFLIPGQRDFSFNEPGRYYLWNEYLTFFDNRSFNQSKELPDGLEIKITDLNSGHSFELVPSSITVTMNNQQRNTVGYIVIEDEAGADVQVVVSGDPEPRVFSLRQADFLSSFRHIFIGIGLAMLTAVAGGGLLVWGIIFLVNSQKKSHPRSKLQG